MLIFIFIKKKIVLSFGLGSNPGSVPTDQYTSWSSGSMILSACHDI